MQNLSRPEEIKALKASLEKDMGEIDFIVHSIAFAPKEGLSGRFYDISKEAFDVAMDISVYSLIEIVRELKPILSNNPFNIQNNCTLFNSFPPVEK